MARGAAQAGAPPEMFAALAFERFSLQPMDGPELADNNARVGRNPTRVAIEPEAAHPSRGCPKKRLVMSVRVGTRCADDGFPIEGNRLIIPSSRGPK